MEKKIKMNNLIETKENKKMNLKIMIKDIIKEEVKKSLNEDNDTSYQEVYNSIDWKKVGDEILKTFKIRTKLKFELSGNYVNMTSDNIIKQCGIFSYAISDCRLEFFNKRLNTTKSSDNKFWATIQFKYPGNGMNIGTIWITQDDKIIIEKDNPR